MSQKIKLSFVVLGLTACLLALADDKPLPQEEPAPPSLPETAQRYLDFYSSSQISFAIDPDSISVPHGADAEVRYTLKATSKRGAVNISYEGIRCSDRKKIIYATGLADGSWTLARNSTWSEIYLRGLNVQHGTLANGYFCSGSTVAGNAEKIVRRIESKMAMDDPTK